MRTTRQLLLVTLGVLLAPLLTRADTGPAGFAFTSPAQAIGVGAVSEQITLQSQDAAGNEFKVPSTACASLSSTSAGGEFSSSATTWNVVSVLTISKNSANRNFYYKDTALGTKTLTAKIALKPESENRSCASWPVVEWPSGWTITQTLTVGTAPSGSSGSATGISPDADTPITSTTETTSSTSATPASSGGSATVPTKPQIFVSASVPSQGIAGAPVTFTAAAVGIKKEPLANARFVWSFGDGAVGEGKKVQHSYHYPAAYVVMVEASSGEWSATDRADIAISAPELAISSIGEGPDGFIEVQNNGKFDVDLSEWMLGSGSGFFVFPRGTIIGAKKRIPFAGAITGLFADPSSSTLLYPNGKLVTRYQSQAPTPELIVEANAPAAVPTERTEPVSVKKEARSAVESPEAPVASARMPLPETSELLGAALATTEQGSSSGFLWGVVLLVALSTLGYMLMLRPRSEPSTADKLRAEAATFDIIEDS